MRWEWSSKGDWRREAHFSAHGWWLWKYWTGCVQFFDSQCAFEWIWVYEFWDQDVGEIGWDRQSCPSTSSALSWSIFLYFLFLIRLPTSKKPDVWVIELNKRKVWSTNKYRRIWLPAFHCSWEAPISFMSSRPCDPSKGKWLLAAPIRGVHERSEISWELIYFIVFL